MNPRDRRNLEKLLDQKLAGMATKEDLAKFEANMATKEALAKLEARVASKEDLAKLESGIRQVLEDGILTQLDRLHTQVGDLSDGMERIERRFEVVVHRQDRQGGALKRHDKRLADHK